MDDKKKAFLKKLIVGISIILSAIAGYFGAKFDDDPATVPNAVEAIKDVKEGVEVIKDAKDELDNSDTESVD